jgi:hypothetical protein
VQLHNDHSNSMVPPIRPHDISSLGNRWKVAEQIIGEFWPVAKLSESSNKLKVYKSGLGQHLTLDEFICLFKEQEAPKEAKETAKVQRKASAVARWAQGNEVEVRWQALKASQAQEITACKLRTASWCQTGCRRSSCQ